MLLDGPDVALLFVEIEDVEPALVADEVAPGAHDPRPPARVGRQPFHGQRGRYAAELEVDHLVVDDVVVAAEDAPAVARPAEPLGDRGVVVAGRVLVAEPGLAPEIDLDRRVRARRLDGTAVGAPGRRPGRGHLLAEEPQRSEGLDLGAGLVRDPAQDVEVVAALRQEHGRRDPAVAPVAADERVGHVDVLDRLEVLDADDPAEPAAGDDVPHHPEVGRVTQDVADADDRPLEPGPVEDVAALRPGLGDGLLEEEIVSPVQGGHRRTVVEMVGGRDDDGIAELGAVESPFPGRPAALRRDAVGLGQERVTIRNWLGYPDDLELFRKGLGIGRIDPAAAARPHDGRRDRPGGLLPLDGRGAPERVGPALLGPDEPVGRHRAGGGPERHQHVPALHVRPPGFHRSHSSGADRGPATAE
ncbi:MAG: hypothetical protein H6P96_1308 [Candidatus Aminicenantes bacterium]|nr:hypothetical protein [Candidatus Aminicenantes bacterium]